jgi:hypothetical protein
MRHNPAVLKLQDNKGLRLHARKPLWLSIKQDRNDIGNIKRNGTHLSIFNAVLRK